jgi:hypothetical protein
MLCERDEITGHTVCIGSPTRIGVSAAEIGEEDQGRSKRMRTPTPDEE